LQVLRHEDLTQGGRICNVGHQRWNDPSTGWMCKACSAFTGGDFYTPAQAASVLYPVYACSLRKTCNRSPGAGLVVEFEPAKSVSYGPSEDRVCTACRTACPATQRISAECADRLDTQCTPCATKCGMNQYLSAAVCDGTTRTDTVLLGCLPCQTVTDCVPGVTYHPGNCTGAERSQTVCSVCLSRLCSAGFYSGGCGGFTPTQCLPYTVCRNGTFLLGAGEANDGVCQPCRNCSLVGRAVETACGGQRNTGCGGDRCNATSGCDETNNTKRYCNYLEDTGTGSLCGVCPVRLFFCLLGALLGGKTGRLTHDVCGSSGTMRTARSASSAPRGGRACERATWRAKGSARLGRVRCATWGWDSPTAREGCVAWER
jgi:hypothetical protein